MAITQSRREYDLALGGTRDGEVVTLESTQTPDLPGFIRASIVASRHCSRRIRHNPIRRSRSPYVPFANLNMRRSSRCGFSRLS